MPPIHDTPQSIGDIFSEVQTNIYDAGLKWYSSTDILNSIQDQYNKVVALLSPIERSTFIPQISEPYYNLGASVADFMYVIGIFNPATNLWLEGLTYKQMKATYQTYLAIGQPKWIDIVDLRRVLVWPYQPTATGVLYLLYKASAPTISPSHIPILPYSCGPQLLEYLTTADLMEQAREFKKAQIWMERAMKPKNPNTNSIFDQCKNEIKNLARMDRESVLEPYRWIFHGGNFSVANWITAETPTGTINGTNAVFTLAQVPNPTNSLLLMLNGQVLFANTQYTFNGQTITYNSRDIPKVDDQMLAYYQVA